MAKELLIRRGFGKLWHRRGSLFAHLDGTSHILECWGQPEHVVLAGLFHGCYSTNVHHSVLFSTEHRESVRSQIGERAERLAYLFFSIDRWQLNSRDLFSKGRESATIASRLGHREAITRTEAAELLIVELANLAEQAADGAGFPKPWLAKGGIFARALCDLESSVSWPFGKRWDVVTNTAETQLIATYRALCLAGSLAVDSDLRNLQGSSYVFSWLGEPTLLRAIYALAAGDVLEAEALVRRSEVAWSDAGFVWDKRLARSEWQLLTASIVSALRNRRNAVQLGNHLLESFRGKGGLRSVLATLNT